MSDNKIFIPVITAVVGCISGAFLYKWLSFNEKSENHHIALVPEERDYSLADQPQRHSKALVEHNKRVLDIISFYDPSYAKGKVVLITGDYS